jgi:hypothetical protein
VTRPAPSILRRIASWVVLLLLFAIVVWAFAVYISSFIDIPWWIAAVGGVAMLAGIIGYQLGTEAIYKRFCEPLGYHCELRPAKGPRSARNAVDLVISGDFRGRPFTLYRESESHARSAFTQRAVRPTIWGVLEWVGDDIRLSKFTLQVNLASSSSADGPLARHLAHSSIAAALTNLATSIRSTPEKSQVEFGPETKLAGRSLMSAPDPAAARTVFTKSVCDALDPLIVLGRIEAGPGLLVIRQFPTTSQELWNRQGRFPLPWDIEEFLKQGDEIRRIFMP